MWFPDVSAPSRFPLTDLGRAPHASRFGGPTAAELTRQRLARVALRVAFGALLLWVLWLAVSFLTVPNVGPSASSGDHATYMDATRRWLAGGSFFQPYQLTGPYKVEMFEILYPPTILPLLASFSFLPDVMWWIVPMSVLIGVCSYWHPTLLGWTLILACLASPYTFVVFAFGNPGMWIAAFLGLGTVYGWPAILVLLKPTLAPFALLGIRGKSWWVALGVLAVVSLLFVPIWAEYFTAIANARGPLVSPLYSLPSVPLMLIPLVARATSERRAPDAPAPIRLGSKE